LQLHDSAYLAGFLAAAFFAGAAAFLAVAVVFAAGFFAAAVLAGALAAVLVVLVVKWQTHFVNL
jgi:ABC-type transport system involved in cytochrome bd biosynthesis fused ATPase/permease subunit